MHRGQSDIDGLSGTTLDTLSAGTGLSNPHYDLEANCMRLHGQKEAGLETKSRWTHGPHPQRKGITLLARLDQESLPGRHALAALPLLGTLGGR